MVYAVIADFAIWRWLVAVVVRADVLFSAVVHGYSFWLKRKFPQSHCEHFLNVYYLASTGASGLSRVVVRRFRFVRQSIRLGIRRGARRGSCRGVLLRRSSPGM